MARHRDSMAVEGNHQPKSEGATTSKKRKASVIIHQSDADNTHYISPSPAKKHKNEEEAADDIDTSRPTAIFQPKAGRDWTVTIALPGSWTLNAKKPDHKTMQVGRIARAAAVFCVDEIVVYDDDPSTVNPHVVSDRYLRQGRNKSKQEILDSIREEDELWQNPDQFLYHLLSFAECPPHLRYDREQPEWSLFKEHQNLRWTGCLPSMDMPHHLRSHEWCPYREGIVVGPAPSPAPSTPSKASNKTNPPTPSPNYAFVKCGLPHPVRVPIPPDSAIEPGMRTTVRFATTVPPASWPHLSPAQCAALDATACPPSLPREEAGYYWGYSVRRAASLSAVFAECEYPGGYDYTIGTSERGVAVHSILPGATQPNATVRAPASFRHLLIVFGGVAGIEPAVANDEVLVAKGLGKATAHELFDAWVNLVPGQGSRTIRTEEAVEFGLCALKPWIDGQWER